MRSDVVGMIVRPQRPAAWRGRAKAAGRAQPDRDLGEPVSSEGGGLCLTVVLVDSFGDLLAGRSRTTARRIPLGSGPKSGILVVDRVPPAPERTVNANYGAVEHG